MASSTASDTRFSEGINSSPVACRRASWRSTSAICGSTSSSGRFIRSLAAVDPDGVGVTSEDVRLMIFVSSVVHRSEEYTSELQSHHDLVCRLLLEKKKKK